MDEDNNKTQCNSCCWIHSSLNISNDHLSCQITLCNFLWYLLGLDFLDHLLELLFFLAMPAERPYLFLTVRQDFLLSVVIDKCPN